MVLTIDLQTLEGRLKPYPTLARKLGAKWLVDHYHEPPWRYDTHPLIWWLWHADVTDAPRLLEEGLELLEAESVSGRAFLYRRLRDARNFLTAVPELFVSVLLLQKGYGISLPRQGPDIRMVQGHHTMDIEIRMLEQTTSMLTLNAMKHALMVDEPYHIEMHIPDTTKIGRADVESTCDHIATILKDRPFNHGQKEGHLVIPIGKSGLSLTLHSSHTGIHSVNSWLYSGYSEAQIQTALYQLRQLMREEAKQIPDGGALIVDITDSGNIYDYISKLLFQPRIYEPLWTDVPKNVHSLWLCARSMDHFQPREMKYSANPFCETGVPFIAANLLANVFYDPQQVGQ